MTAYYNEIDPFSVAWLRELIREGAIADGIVDDRSVEIVEPGDLDGFTQCHFFAGIGVWSYALRLAGWPDDRPVWTGSCPCQPFSSAGKEEGFSDPRHLWPSWFRLARVRRPVAIFGEQVERAIRSHWLDLVSTDLEAEGYAVGSTVFGSHSVGAPHQRQRVYFVADGNPSGISNPDRQRRARADALLRTQTDGRRREGAVPEITRRGATSGVSDAANPGRPEGNGRSMGGTERQSDGVESETRGDSQAAEYRRAVGRLSDADGTEQGQREFGLHPADRNDHGSSSVRERTDDAVSLGDSVGARLERHDGYVDDWNEPRRVRTFPSGSTTPTGILSGFWDGAEWIECSDGKARPVEPGSFPLAYGSPARVGRLRGYGNAINAEAAAAFVVAFREVKGEL